MIRHGNSDAVKGLLAQGVSLDSRDESGKTALDLAISLEHHEIVGMLAQVLQGQLHSA